MKSLTERLPHIHQWFSTGEMKPGQLRCIGCGKWGETYDAEKAEIDRLTAENLRLAGEVSNRNSRALAGDTATRQFDAMYEAIERLEAENAALKAKMLDNWVNKDAIVKACTP